jgi:hypothetical protein
MPSTVTTPLEITVADERHPVGRAPRSDGPRTTLRLSPELAAVADRLAAELHVSRNDALLRLAARGAAIYESEREIAERAEQRWAAVLARDAGLPADGEHPSSDELDEAVMNAWADLFDLPPDE